MSYKQEYERWLHSDALSPAEHAELERIAGDEKEIENRFYGPLEFGTAGLRGTMKVGLHQMNIHVIRWATQGFANVIAAEGEDAKKKGVAICMDCRNNNMLFSHAAAEVCAANGIHVRIFESLRPTPELSFAVRYYGCQAGINVTPSHNPKEYNGYKVYWSDGAQLPPQHADAIAAQLEKIDIFTGIKRMDFDEAVKAGLIEIMGEETDRAFMENVMAMVNDRESMAKVADTFKVVYTPFHGCGWKLVPEALRSLGVKHLYCVEQQMVLDGNFPTVDSPNPENPEGFYLAIELADKVGADFILGTDPDSDRVGIMVRDHAGKFIAVTGNQTGVLLLDYLIGALRRACGDRAVMRAIHFYQENARVPQQVAALEKGDFDRFLSLVKQSGYSSYMYLQNVIPAGYKAHQDVAVALALCEHYLAGRGAYRVHGGGFAGSILGFVSNAEVENYVASMKKVFGEENVFTANVRRFGTCGFKL